MFTQISKLLVAVLAGEWIMSQQVPHLLTETSEYAAASKSAIKPEGAGRNKLRQEL
eukprot:CAMPEP_0119027352 /NCGR_PEP_ID=MMETSP1176-20130426/36978_1 /TAXON_ID=265551 /ORGANISM="Synedropsis recta cf, Strain CCMP1620" /LENGTH=55 /DNA_ID=CAMNT_0006983251 /DNA_START=155 /DNA_END=319 /DNA_ORIENTATION=+